MSLMLRKYAQSILDKQDLDDYHAAIDNDNKYLQVVGPCGKPLFNITGIVFTRLSPTMKEIEFACELLEEFFIANKMKLIAFLKAQREYFKHKDTKINLPKDFISGYTTNGYGDSQYINTFTLKFTAKEEELTLVIDKKGKNPKFAYKCNAIKLADAGKLLKNIKLRKELTTLIHTTSVENITRVAHEAALEVLQTCDI